MTSLDWASGSMIFRALGLRPDVAAAEAKEAGDR